MHPRKIHEWSQIVPMLRNEYAKAAQAFFDGLVREGMAGELALELVCRWCMFQVRLPAGPILQEPDEDAE